MGRGSSMGNAGLGTAHFGQSGSQWSLEVVTWGGTDTWACLHAEVGSARELEAEAKDRRNANV